MPRRIALVFLAIASPAILLVSWADIRHGEVLFALLAVAFPMALIALGAAGRRGELGPLAWPLLGLTVFLEVCVISMYLLRGDVAEGSWIFALPLAAAIQVYGIFLAPLLFVSWLYAATFERFGLRQDDLESLRRRFGTGSDAGDRES